MYVLKFENDMGYDGGVTTEIIAVSADKSALESLAQDIEKQFGEYAEEAHEKTFAIYSKHNFVSGHIPENIQNECAEMNKDLLNKYSLLSEFDRVLDHLSNHAERNEFIIESIKVLD